MAYHLFLFWALFALTSNAGELLCNDGSLYGHVTKDVAMELANLTPYSNKPEESALFEAMRIFAEPGFFTPRFAPLPNQVPDLEMAQLPRLWKKSMSPVGIGRTYSAFDSFPVGL